MTESTIDLQRRVSRRAVLQGATATLAISLLNACSQPASPAATSAPTKEAVPTTKAKITFAWPFAYATEFMPELAKRFAEQKKTIEVEIQPIPQSDAVPKLTNAFSGGAGPDCTALSIAWVAQFAAAGWLEKLDDRLNSSGIEKNMAAAAVGESRIYKGLAYAVSYTVSCFPFFYNNQLLTEAGYSAAPQTQDDLAQYAKKITDAAKNRFGFYVLGAGGWSYYQWTMWATGEGGLGDKGTLFDASGKCILNSPKHVAGFQRWLNLYQTDKVSPPASVTGTFENANNAFAAGQAAMITGWLPQIANSTKAMGADKFTVTWPPKGPTGQFIHIGTDGMSLNANSKNKEAAWEWMAYLMGPEVNPSLTEQVPALPARLDAMGAPYIKNQPHFKAPVEMIQRAESIMYNPKQMPEFGTLSTVKFPEEVQKALLGQQTAQQTCDTMAGLLTAAYANYAKSAESSVAIARRQDTSLAALRRRSFPYLLVAPVVILVLAGIVYPLAYLLYLGGTNYSPFVRASGAFVGLANYTRLLADADTWRALSASAIWVVGSVVPQFVLGLAMALLLNEKFPVRVCRCRVSHSRSEFGESQAAGRFYLRNSISKYRQSAPGRPGARRVYPSQTLIQRYGAPQSPASRITSLWLKNSMPSSSSD